MTFLPLDSNNNPIPALRFKDGGAHAIQAEASSARNSVGFASTTKIISLYADVPVYLALGDDSVMATTNDHFFPAGVYYDISIGDAKSGHDTHIAVLRASTDGTVYISEKI